MPANYVSATFETLYQAPPVDAYRCIVRSRDDGPAPPAPTSTYFPTEPNGLRDFLLFEHVNDTVGERLVGVATPGDFDLYEPKRLTRFTDPTVNFITAGVQAGDLLQIYMANPEVWASTEYPDAGLRFAIASVSTHVLELTVPLPAWRRNLSWGIPARGLTRAGSGRTVREGSPAPLDRYLDRRYQGWFASQPDLDTFIAATKTGMDLLGLQVTQAKSSTSTSSYTSTYARSPVTPDVGG